MGDESFSDVVEIGDRLWGRLEPLSIVLDRRKASS
jgi:hypothetical protein